jgi:hypothetical protein
LVDKPIELGLQKTFFNHINGSTQLMFGVVPNYRVEDWAKSDCQEIRPTTRRMQISPSRNRGYYRDVPPPDGDKASMTILFNKKVQADRDNEIKIYLS